MARLIAPLSADERTGLIAAARSLLNAPFRHRGRSPAGVDCLGLLVLSMQAIGHAMHDRDRYGRDPSGDLGAMQQAARAHFGEPIFHKGQSLDLLQPGDVLLMRWHQQPNHVAIVSTHPNGGLAVIHAYKQAERVVEHGLTAQWPRRCLEGYRP